MRTERWGLMALLAVTVVWGTTFPAMKLLSAQLDALQIIWLRFAIALVVLLPLWRGMHRHERRWGCALGLLLFLAFWLANCLTFLVGAGAFMLNDWRGDTPALRSLLATEMQMLQRYGEQAGRQGHECGQRARRGDQGHVESPQGTEKVVSPGFCGRARGASILAGPK